MQIDQLHVNRHMPNSMYQNYHYGIQFTLISKVMGWADGSLTASTPDVSLLEDTRVVTWPVMSIVMSDF